MTAQAHDSLLLDGTSYDIVAIENPWPFHPSMHGLMPEPFSSSCCRGYTAEYVVHGDCLVLDVLAISVAVSKPPTFSGIRPRHGRQSADHRQWEYRNIGLPVRYSGGLVIGSGFLPKHYVHMGFQSPHCFRTVKEVRFSDGLTRDQQDLSERVEQVRQRLLTPTRFSATLVTEPVDFHESVRKAFSLAYEDKWPS